MTITYQVRFHDETGTRTRHFKNREAAQWWPAGNRPGIGYVIVRVIRTRCMLRSRMR